MTASRQPLGNAVVILIVVDAVLVLTFLVLLLQAGRADLAGSPSAPTPGQTTSHTPGSTVAFAMPSGNISCTIGKDAARCAIAEFSYDPPSVAGCTGTTGHEIELTADGARWLCTTGEPPGVAGSDVEVLGYGSSTAANGFTCQSSTEGVSCRHDDSGHAFSLARAGATLD